MWWSSAQGLRGLAAASVTAAAGLATLLADENATPGGQIYRAVTTTPVRDRAILGDDYWHGATLVETARRSGAEMLSGALVWSLDASLTLGLSHGGIARMVQARRVIVATGAQERPFPIPGWTLPGVMTVGGAQTLLKASGLVTQGRAVIAGMGPLLWLYAAQVLRAGGRIEAILDTTPRGALLRAMPYAPGLMLSPLFAKGRALMREVRRRVTVVAAVTELSASGGARVREIAFRSGGGETRTLPLDTLLLHQGVVPSTSLAMAAGVAHRWDPLQHCWVPVLDDALQSSVPGVSVAGDGGGIAGAWAAEARGRLAGIAAVRALKPDARVPDEQAVRHALVRHLLGRRFLDTLYEPSAATRIPADDVIACRCEEVTAGRIRETVAMGCEGPNQMKALTRCGMGPCQGRLCHLTVTEVIAAARGVSPAEVGTYRVRPPVKPIPLSEFAAMSAGDEAMRAVVRL